MLIGVNGTPASIQAYELGLTWAKAHQTPVTCLAVVDVDGLGSPETLPLGEGTFKASRDSEAVARERAKLAAALQTAGESAQARGVDCRLVQLDGIPSEVLTLEAQRHDLLVLGRRPPSAASGQAGPSATLTDIVRRASRPVIVAGDGSPQSSNVVVAYDGSPQAACTLQAFVQSGLHFGHPLHLVGVGEDPIGAQFRLMRALDYLRAHGRQAELHVLPVRGSVAVTLAQFVRQLPCGLLVMGVSSRPWLTELLFGSVTRSMLHEVPAPLFLYH
jgi:nucleotide-binding universal stress UspA family protein